MENYLKYNWFKIILVGIILLVGGVFYWFEFRPVQIRKDCIKKFPHAFRQKTSNDGQSAFYDFVEGVNDKEDYKKCLTERGLEK